MKSKELIEDLTAICEACETIKVADGCEKCPFERKEICIDYIDFKVVCGDLTEHLLTEFFDFLDDIEHPITEDDIIASYADMARKAERDEYYD